jgi:D-alanyl-D-alanine carboxypeptidase
VTSDSRVLTRRAQTILIVMAVMALHCACTSTSTGSVESHGAGVPDLDRALEPLVARGAVALLRTDAGTWRGASGDTEFGRPAEPQDRFGIGSTTKTFVATVVLQLVGEGRLSLEDSIEDVLPGALPYGGRISVRELLNHSSGLNDAYVPELSARKKLEAIAEAPLLFRPGTMHRYANVNYVVLGFIVEEVTGRPVEEVVRNRILAPLDLDHTSFGRATTSSFQAAPWLGYKGVPPGADGGMISTADDEATFFRALLGGELIGPDLLAEMTRTIAGGEGFRAGLGIFEQELSCGAAWGHGGDWPTYSSMALASRDGSKVVIVAQNSGGWTAALDVAEEIYCS